MDGDHKQSPRNILRWAMRRLAKEGSDIHRALRGLKPQSPACSWAASQVGWHLSDGGSLLKHALRATHGTVRENAVHA